MDEISSRIRAARERLGYTQSRMAEAVGGKLRGWQEYEKGRSQPGGRVLAHLVALGINANWLLTGEGPMFTKDLATAHEPLDRELLMRVIETIEVTLEKAQGRMPPEKKANVIVALYDICSNSGTQPESESVIQLILSAA